MAYDTILADRIRELMEPEPDVTEKKMFGGLAFLLSGNMALAASRSGGLLVRVDPEQSAELLGRGQVETMVMGGREMHGWLHVASEALADERVLGEWVERGVGYARTLPPKRGE